MNIKKIWTNESVKKAIKAEGFKLAVFAIFLLALAACGSSNSSSSKSLKDYSDLKKTLGPVHNSQPVTQTYIASDLYTVELDSSTPANYIFVVGKKNVVRFRTALHLKGVRYRLVSSDLPQGSQPLQDKGQGIWEFSWTPNSDLIPNSATDLVEGKFHVSLQILDVQDPRIRELAQSIATEQEINYGLLRSGVAPEISEILGVAPAPQITKMNEGDVIEVTIHVKDSSSNSKQSPKLVSIATANIITNERRVISGNRFFILETEPRLIKSGYWEFKGWFDTKNNSVPEFDINGKVDLAPSVTAKLSLQVLSSNRTISTVKEVPFEITYRRELLKPVFKIDAKSNAVKSAQGSIFNLAFESSLGSSVGNMVTNLSEETQNLPGNPSLSCKSNKSKNNQQLCQLKWKIPCTQVPMEVNLKIISSAEYQDQNTSTELTKTLTIEENKKCEGTDSGSIPMNDLEKKKDTQKNSKEKNSKNQKKENAGVIPKESVQGSQQSDVTEPKKKSPTLPSGKGTIPSDQKSKLVSKNKTGSKNSKTASAPSPLTKKKSLSETQKGSNKSTGSTTKNSQKTNSQEKPKLKSLDPIPPLSAPVTPKKLSNSSTQSKNLNSLPLDSKEKNQKKDSKGVSAPKPDSAKKNEVANSGGRK